MMEIKSSNPWHTVNIGENAPHIVNGIIEIPPNTRAKYELDKDSGLLKLDRVLYASMNYPANYGFIPKTYCDDKDPLDILILSQKFATSFLTPRYHLKLYAFFVPNGPLNYLQ